MVFHRGKELLEANLYDIMSLDKRRSESYLSFLDSFAESHIAHNVRGQEDIFLSTKRDRLIVENSKYR